MALTVGACLAGLSALEVFLQLAFLEEFNSESMAWEIVWRICLVLVGTGSALAVAWTWQARLNRQMANLLVACRRLALGQKTHLGDFRGPWNAINSLGLAIQVMHEALSEQLSIYRRFFDESPDMFVSISPVAGTVLEANQAFCRAVGRLPSEVLGRKAQDFLSLDLGWDVSGEPVQQLQAGHLRTDQGIMKVEANLTLERGSQGKLWVVGAILRDVSRHEALMQELLRKSSALERALMEIKKVEDLKDQFLTTLSHELKTPLVSLKGFLQLLLSDRGTPQEQRSYLDICWRNLGKLEKQINNLLDLARLSNAKEQYEMNSVELGALVRTEAENLKALAQEKGVSLDLARIQPEPLMVLGNAEKLIQLVDNLLVNAVKYNVEGGAVEVALEQRGHQALLTVADSGVGIAREHMAKIFNRFYQANLTGTGRLEGLGIGLSLVQEIVLLHGGDIRVESQPGVGTTFTVILEAMT